MIEIIGWVLDAVGFLFILQGWANPIHRTGWGGVTGIDYLPGEEKVILDWEKRGSIPYLRQPNRMKRDACTFLIGTGLLIQLFSLVSSSC